MKVKEERTRRTRKKASKRLKSNAMDAKRKQPIYLAISPKTLEEHYFPDITLDYIMEL